MSCRVLTSKQMAECIARVSAASTFVSMSIPPGRFRRTEVLQAALLDLQHLPHPVEACYAFAEVLMVRLEKTFGDPAKPTESTK